MKDMFQRLNDSEELKRILGAYLKVCYNGDYKYIEDIKVKEIKLSDKFGFGFVAVCDEIYQNDQSFEKEYPLFTLKEFYTKEFLDEDLVMLLFGPRMYISWNCFCGRLMKEHKLFGFECFANEKVNEAHSKLMQDKLNVDDSHYCKTRPDGDTGLLTYYDVTPKEGKQYHLSDYSTDQFEKRFFIEVFGQEYIDFLKSIRMTRKDCERDKMPVNYSNHLMLYEAFLECYYDRKKVAHMTRNYSKSNNKEKLMKIQDEFSQFYQTYKYGLVD